jgi:hypothetical protein
VKHRFITALACGTLLASAAVAAPATADDWQPSPPTAGKPYTVASGFNGPLSLEVDRHGVSYVSENFAGKLTRINRDGTVNTLVTAPKGTELSAVSSRRGTVYYAQSRGNETGHDAATLYALDPGHSPRRLANIYAYEKRVNPDKGNTYGFSGLSASCQAQIAKARPEFASVLKPYKGQIDTHPFATLPTRNGVYVADAGGNAILRVRYDGSVSTVAVLPALAPSAITADVATAQRLPRCAVGSTFIAEPVPTDVELGPDGWLYVTSLPGGPEDASLGARGAVLKVNPWNGRIETVARGFVGATNLAVSQRSGNVYVTELFGGAKGAGQVSVLTRRSDTPKVLLALPSPAALELRSGKLYVTTDVFVPNGGKVVAVPLKEKNRWGHDTDSVTEDSFSSDDE